MIKTKQNRSALGSKVPCSRGHLWLWCFHLHLTALSYETAFLFSLSQLPVSSQHISVETGDENVDHPILCPLQSVFHGMFIICNLIMLKLGKIDTLLEIRVQFESAVIQDVEHPSVH